MPEEVDECVKSVLEENPDYSESRAYAICNAMQNRGELSVGEDATHDELLEAAAVEGPCPDGQVNIGDECVPYETVEAPPSILSTPQHLTLKSLDTEPIERVEADGDRVRYRNLKLLSPGIWSDAGSETATFYPPDGIANLTPAWDDSEHDGPPVNIMHDLDMEDFEAHEASVAGHIDPESLDTDDDGNLFGDVVFDTSKGAGQFADDNLKSTLEKEGTVGFGGPSVEIPAEGLEQSRDPQRDMPRVDGGRLSGVAMVMDPASKDVNFAREAARRPIAMSVGGDKAKALTRETEDMSGATREDIRDEIMQRTLQIGEIQDDAEAIADELDVPVDEVMELLDPLMDMGEDEADDDGAEMEDDEDEDGDEDDEDEDDTEMADDDMEAVMERITNFESRLEDVEDAVSQAMTAEDVDAELEEAVGEQLAAADTVDEVKKTLSEVEATVEKVANKPAESKTLADADGEDFEPEYDLRPSSETSW